VLVPKSGTFPLDSTQFCTVSPGSSVQFEIKHTLVGRCKNKQLIAYKVGARYFSASLI
jgi:hypothetical protein